jgi:hypothetical protein
MVRFMTRLGIKGNLAYFHSQVKKAIMVTPPTTNMAIKDPTERILPKMSPDPTTCSTHRDAMLTIFVPMIGTSSQTERQEDQGESESEEDQPEPVDSSPVEDHPGPDGLGSVLALDLLLKTEIRGGDRDGWLVKRSSMTGLSAGFEIRCDTELRIDLLPAFLAR